LSVRNPAARLSARTRVLPLSSRAKELLCAEPTDDASMTFNDLVALLEEHDAVGALGCDALEVASERACDGACDVHRPRG